MGSLRSSPGLRRRRAKTPERERVLCEQPTTNNVELQLLVERAAPFALPLTIHLALPPGVKSAQPWRDITLAPNQSADEQRIAIKLRGARVPREPVRVTVSGRTAHMGVHSEQEYRFGRAAERLRALEYTTRSLRLGAHDLGEAVRVARR